MEKRHYGAIDGLRMIAAFGIAMMHIRANSNYEIAGYVYKQVIPSFTNFVFLFMTVSAFGMCCGYYDKILSEGQSRFHRVLRKEIQKNSAIFRSSCIAGHYHVSVGSVPL